MMHPEELNKEVLSICHQVKVSILATVLNEELFVGAMIESIAAQDYANFELIVVNDGSTDSTGQILSLMQAKYPWLKVITFPKNKGKCSAQNAAFNAATGDLIAIHGGDDRSHPSRISQQVSFVQKYSLEACIAEMSTVDENDNTIRPVYGTQLKPTSCPRALLNGASFPAGTIMITKALAEKIYPIPEDLPYEDRWIAFKIQMNTQLIGFIGNVLYDYRQHIGNSWLVKKHNSFFQNYVGLRKMVIRDIAVDRAIYNALPPSVQAKISGEYMLQNIFRRRVSGSLSLLDVFKSGILPGLVMPCNRAKLLAIFFPRTYLGYRGLVLVMRGQKMPRQTSTDLVVPIRPCKDKGCSNCG